jgi:hypothetical protein
LRWAKGKGKERKLGNVGEGLMLFSHTENPLEILVVLAVTALVTFKVF